MQPRFADHAWEDYLYWHETDRKQLKRINALIEDIRRHPFTGIGKPEPLKHQLAGFWSRRIDDRHRLVYAVEGEVVLIAQCRDHYCSPGVRSFIRSPAQRYTSRRLPICKTSTRITPSSMLQMTR